MARIHRHLAHGINQRLLMLYAVQVVLYQNHADTETPGRTWGDYFCLRNRAPATSYEPTALSQNSTSWLEGPLQERQTAPYRIIGPPLFFVTWVGHFITRDRVTWLTRMWFANLVNEDLTKKLCRISQQHYDKATKKFSGLAVPEKFGGEIVNAALSWLLVDEEARTPVTPATLVQHATFIEETRLLLQHVEDFRDFQCCNVGNPNLETTMEAAAAEPQRLLRKRIIRWWRSWHPLLIDVTFQEAEMVQNGHFNRTAKDRGLNTDAPHKITDRKWKAYGLCSFCNGCAPC